jgi:hypothetical protein
MIDWAWVMKKIISGRQQKNGIATPIKVLFNLTRRKQMETDPKMLREIANDDLTPKKHDFAIQKELHEKIRNDEDYDDWEYGTEPIPLTEF